MHSEIAVERCEPLSASRDNGGGLVHLRALVRTTSSGGAIGNVLDQQLTGVMA